MLGGIGKLIFQDLTLGSTYGSICNPGGGRRLVNFAFFLERKKNIYDETKIF